MEALKFVNATHMVKQKKKLQNTVKYVTDKHDVGIVIFPLLALYMIVLLIQV